MQSPPLAPGWTEHLAPTGQLYYFNASTGVSTYERPGMPALAAGGSAATAAVPPPPPDSEDESEDDDDDENQEQQQQQQTRHQAEAGPSSPNPTEAVQATEAATGSSSTGEVQEPSTSNLDSAAQEAENGQDSTQEVKDEKKKKKHKKKHDHKVKEKPVDKVAIQGTPWLKVTTNVGNVFYTNTMTRTSVWTIPEEIAGIVRAQEEAQRQAELRRSRAAEEATRLLREKEAEMERLREELEREREASRKRKIEEEEEEEQQQREMLEQQQQQASKRARVNDDSANGHGPTSPEGGEDGQSDVEAQEEQQLEEEEEEELEDWQKDELRIKAEQAELEKELETPAAKVAEEEFSSEESIALFKTMLSEKDINPMRPWDMELPKFITDPRYKAVRTLRERRDLFDEFCKHKVRENRTKKNAEGGSAKKADPAAAYRALLVAEVKSTRTHWDDFRRAHKKDARFRDFGRDDKERERAFRLWLRELGEIKRADAEKAEAKFLEMLSEKDVPEGASWSSVKTQFSSDPRYGAVQSSSQREGLFQKFLAERKTKAAQQKESLVVVDPEEAKRKAEADRKARQAASLREREEKVRREKEALNRAAGRSRAEAGKEVSQREFKSLLIDAVRDHDARWSDSVRELETDPRFTSSTLSSSEKRDMFEEHVNDLYDKRIRAIESLFAENASNLQTPFEQVYEKISSNPIVTRMKMSKDRLDRTYQDWSRRRYATSRDEFEQLLRENNFVEYWGRMKAELAAGSSGSGSRGGRVGNDDAEEEDRVKNILGESAADAEEGMEGDPEEAVDLRTMASQIDLKELEAVLKHDKRYAIFDYDPETRRKWIREHIDKLSRPKQTVHQQERR